MVFTQDRTTYLAMDAIFGSTLEVAASKMEATALEKTAQQLQPAVDQLWSLTSSFPSPSEDNYYGQWSGTSFASCNRRFALRETVPVFSSFRNLLSYILSTASDVDLATSLEGKLDSDDTRLTLTNGNLAPHNIMVEAPSWQYLIGRCSDGIQHFGSECSSSCVVVKNACVMHWSQPSMVHWKSI
jgi:hypothetical protein